VLCMRFSTSETGEQSMRYHIKITPAFRDSLAKHYGRFIGKLIDNPVKLRAMSIDAYGKKIMLFRPVPLQGDEELDINF